MINYNFFTWCIDRETNKIRANFSTTEPIMKLEIFSDSSMHDQDAMLQFINSIQSIRFGEFAPFARSGINLEAGFAAHTVKHAPYV